MGGVDLAIRQGDTFPPLVSAVTDQHGHPLDLTGASVTFVMRQLGSQTPTVSSAATITSATNGQVTYSWAATDTASPGLYMAEAHVTFEDGDTYTWPHDGWLVISVEPSLAAAGLPTELVSVADAKDALNMPAAIREHDAKVLRWIRAIRPTVENIVGPIIPQQFEEWHPGGQAFINVNYPPSVGLGTSPYFQVQAISEYLGPIEWPLSIIASPDMGQLYSAQPDVIRGQIVRRTPGGGMQAFPDGRQAVHVWYTSGQSSVPDNVYEAALEILRANYQQTAQQSRLRQQDPGSAQPANDAPSFLVTPLARQLLSPNRRHPSIA